MSYINSFRGRWAFLSNFYPCKIEHKGITYPSVEHYYVALKANTMQFINGQYYTAPDFREVIAKIQDPKDVKAIGKKIKIRTDWEENKLKFMEWGVREKFKDNNLSQMLLSTGDLQLIEANNWHDTFWGVCFCSKCNNKGSNHLGEILMKVRNELKSLNQKPSIENLIKDKNKTI